MESFTWKIGLLLILVELIQCFELQNDVSNLRCTGKPLDLVFAVDASVDVSTHQFQKQVSIIKHVVNNMDIGMRDDQVRIGAISFGEKEQVNLLFSQSRDRRVVRSKIDRMRQLDGKSNLANTLRRICGGSMFDQREGSRSNVMHMGIILTDGILQDGTDSRRAAQMCRESGVELFAITLGKVSNGAPVLRDIVSQPVHTHFLHFASFDDTHRIGHYVIQRACQAVLALDSKDRNGQSRQGKALDNPEDSQLDGKVCNSSQPTDVMFMLNQNHLGQKTTNSVMRMVADVVEKLGTSGTFRIGTMFDECPVTHDITIGSIMNKTKLLNRIDDFQYSTPKSLIQQLRFDVFSHRVRSYDRRTWYRRRRRARRLGLIFVDREIKLDDPGIRYASRRALQRGIQLYAIVVGKGVNLNQVQKSIAPRDRIILMPSYETLETSLPSTLVNRLCLKRNTYIAYNTLSR